MAAAFSLIIYVTIAGAFIFGAILYYFTRGVVKSAIISSLIAVTITGMQMQQESAHTFYNLLFTLISKAGLFSFLILFISGAAGAMISRHYLRKEGGWQNLNSGNQGLVIGLVFWFMSGYWFNIPTNYFYTLVIFSAGGYLLGRFLVGQTLKEFKLTFFNIFLIFCVVIGTAHAIKFEMVKNEKRNFLDEYFTEEAPLGPSAMIIDKVNGFGGKINFEEPILIQFSVNEEGIDYDSLEDLYLVGQKYIKQLPALSEVEIVNDRRIRYDYDGKRHDLFFNHIAFHPEEGYTYISMEHTYNVIISEKTQKTLEFLKTHINPEYLPPDLESNIIDQGMHDIPESTYLVSGGKYFGGKQYTRFDDKENIVFIYAAWRDDFPQNFTGVDTFLRKIIKSLPQNTLEFDVEDISYLVDHKKTSTTQYVSKYDYAGEEYELVFRNVTGWPWIRLKKSKVSLNPVKDKEHAMSLAREYYPELDFIDTELIHTDFEALWFVLYRGYREKDNWEYTSCVLINAEDYSKHWKHNLYQTASSYSYESAMGSCIANL